MLENPLLSIIVPVFNSEKYLEKCLDSISPLLDRNVELIIVDDGSLDDSIQICEKFSQINSNTFFYKKTNGGVSSARNYGINKSKGKYVTFIDSDDWIDDEKFVKVLDLLENDSYDIVSYNMIKASNRKNKKIPFKELSLEYSFIFYPVYMHSVCNKVFRRNLLDSEGIEFNELISQSEDLLFTIECYVKAKSVKFLNENIYYYRTNLESATHNFEWKSLVDNERKINGMIASILAQSNQVDIFQHYMTHRNTSIAMYYLLEPSLYSIDEYRRINSEKAEWINKREVMHCILCFAANHKLYMINNFFIKHKL